MDIKHAKRGETSAQDVKALLHAAEFGDIDNARSLLDKGMDPNIKDGFNSPLHLAAKGGHLAVVELFLSYGADPNIRGDSGSTALHHAARNGDYVIAQLLLGYSTDPNIEDDEAYSPLFYAANNSHNDIMKLLRDSGAHLDSVPRHLHSRMPSGDLRRKAQDTPMYPITINGVSLDQSSDSSTNSPTAENDYILVQGRTHLTNDDEQQLSILGVKKLDYVSKNTYLCRYPARDLAKLRDLDFLAYVGNFQTEFKIGPGFIEVIQDKTERDQKYEVDVIFHKSVNTNQDELKKKLEDESQTTDQIQMLPHMARLFIENRYLAAVVSIDEVRRIEEVREIVGFDDLSGGLVTE